MNFNLSHLNRTLNLKFRRFVNAKALLSSSSERFLCATGRTGLKRAAGTHERLFTVICAVGSFLCLALPLNT